MQSAFGMVPVVTNNQLRAKEDAELKAKKEAQERQGRPFILGLVHDLRDKWDAAKAAKHEIEQEMLTDIRNRKGVYSAAKLAEINKQGGSAIFMMLGEEKASAVTAWLKDIYFGNPNNKIWGTKTTPVPELNPAQKAQIVEKVMAEAQTEMRAMVEAEIQQGLIKTNQQAKERFSMMMVERMEELAGEVQEAEQAAANKAENRIETKLDDIIVESGFNKVLQLLLDDINTFKCAILKGPIQMSKKKIVWDHRPPGQGPAHAQLPAPGQEGGKPERPVKVKDVLSWKFERVSAMDIYPLPDAENFDQGFFQRHRLTKSALYAMKKIPGFDSDAIDLVLRDYTAGAVDWLNVSIDHARQRLEDRPDEWRKTGGKIDALQFWGDIQGLQLLQYGMDPEKIEDPMVSYKCEVWLIDKYVIKAELNGNPLGKVPYFKTSFRRNNGSFWGKSTLSLIKDSIDACNASARNMLNNAAISSGPQVGVDYSQIREGDHVTGMYPWKVWAFDGNAPGGMSQKDPIRFFVPPSTLAELIKLYTFFSEQADEKTGAPKYSYGGNQKGGPLDTARGFTMMMNSVARGIKSVVSNIDDDIIAPAIIYLYEMQLLYSNDPEWFQSDLTILAQGSISLVMKEAAALRRNEFLNIAMNPTVLQVIGIEGFAEILRAVAEGLDLPSGNIVPSKETIARKAKLAQLTATAGKEEGKPGKDEENTQKGQSDGED